MDPIGIEAAISLKNLKILDKELDKFRKNIVAALNAELNLEPTDKELYKNIFHN